MIGMQSMQSMQWSKMKMSENPAAPLRQSNQYIYNKYAKHAKYALMKMSENPPTPLRQSNLSRRVKLRTGFMNRQINLQKYFANR